MPFFSPSVQTKIAFFSPEKEFLLNYLFHEIKGLEVIYINICFSLKHWPAVITVRKTVFAVKEQLSPCNIWSSLSPSVSWCEGKSWSCWRRRCFQRHRSSRPGLPSAKAEQREKKGFIYCMMAFLSNTAVYRTHNWTMRQTMFWHLASSCFPNSHVIEQQLYTQIVY